MGPRQHPPNMDLQPGSVLQSRRSELQLREPERRHAIPGVVPQPPAGDAKSFHAAYVTDEWKPASSLTLNLGLRYDVQTGVWNEWRTQSEYPRPLPYVDFASRGDKNNVEPRLGLAWNVRGDRKSVVRLGYGLV